MKMRSLLSATLLAATLLSQQSFAANGAPILYCSQIDAGKEAHLHYTPNEKDMIVRGVLKGSLVWAVPLESNPGWAEVKSVIYAKSALYESGNYEVPMNPRTAYMKLDATVFEFRGFCPP